MRHHDKKAFPRSTTSVDLTARQYCRIICTIFTVVPLML